VAEAELAAEALFSGERPRGAHCPASPGYAVSLDRDALCTTRAGEDARSNRHGRISILAV